MYKRQIRRYLHLPLGSRKVVLREDSWSRTIWKYPFTASIFAKYFAVAGIVYRISDTQANGCTGLSTKELSLVKSDSILMFFVTTYSPDIGCLKNPTPVSS